MNLAARCTLIVQTRSALFAILSCVVLSELSNIDTVLMDRVSTFHSILVYIHSANDLLKNCGRLHTLASELSRHGGLTHASVLQMLTHKTNIVVMRVRLMISHHDVVDRRKWLTRSTGFFVSLLSAESSWMSISRYSSTVHSEWWIYFFNGLLWCCSQQYFHLAAQTEESGTKSTYVMCGM